jgi:signal peptidase I
LTYHFRKPKAGDPFVFRTQKILQAVGKATGDYTPKYYIKRIGGVENETLEIVDHTLIVDGQPRDEVPAFGRNARLEGEYVGYQNVKLLAEGKKMKVPENSYVALGDNSGNSADSRYWGFVPQESVIGRAIFIYYPFTKRWGLSE